MRRLIDLIGRYRIGMIAASAAITMVNAGFYTLPVLAKVKPAAITTRAKIDQGDPIQQAIASLRQSDKRWIEVNVATQRLIAWKGNKPIWAVKVSTGKPSTPTLTGVFAVELKYRYARMQGADYDVPAVPFTMYYDGNYAIHGAYWHNQFGTPVSHGCVNVAPNHAGWLFKWASVGTPVVVRR